MPQKLSLQNGKLRNSLLSKGAKNLERLAVKAWMKRRMEAAIKTKLMDLGVCVEEELPDYVMVMIANKRSTEQMNEDLNLFLGNNTENFTNWLSDLLNRIQSVTAEETVVDTNLKVANSANTDDQSKVSTSSSQPALSSDRYDANKKTTKQQKLKINRPQINVVSQESNTITANSASELEDVLALKAELEDDLFEEELKQEQSSSKVSTSPKIIIQNQTGLKQEETKIQTVIPTRKKIVLVRPATATPIPEKRRGPVSTVGAVVQRPEEIEPEYNPANPAIGKVASIIKVSERKSSVPKSKQANKNLLMKAMREAQESVLENSKKIKQDVNLVEQVEPSVTSDLNVNLPAQANLFSRRVLPKPYIPEDVPVIEPEPAIYDNELIEYVPEKLPADDLRNRRNQFVLNGDKIERKPVIYEPVESMDIGDDEVGAQMPELSHKPSFIITLNGIDKNNFPKTAKKRSYITFNDASEDEDKSEENFFDNDEEYDSDGHVDKKKMKLPERCKFWPTCKNGDDCEYHHPNSSCRLFPKCKFGDKCLYIHPNCKYDAKCTKEDCPFTHASKRNLNSSNATPVPETSPSTSEVECKFFPNCKKTSCPFKHVKTCRYSFNCKRPDCSFSHPALPTRDKLKWTACEKTETFQKEEGIF